MSDNISENLAASVLRLGNECRALADENKTLKAEVERLKQQAQYWKIEAECDHGRWLRCLEDLEKLRKESIPKP